MSEKPILGYLIDSADMGFDILPVRDPADAKRLTRLTEKAGVQKLAMFPPRFFKTYSQACFGRMFLQNLETGGLSASTLRQYYGDADWKGAEAQAFWYTEAFKAKGVTVEFVYKISYRLFYLMAVQELKETYKRLQSLYKKVG